MASVNKNQPILVEVPNRHIKENMFTIPNLLSFFRLVSFPFILWFIIDGRETLFVAFIIVNLITDALDGILARKLDQETVFGARLDSIADKFTYALAVIGILAFRLEELRPHLFSFFLFIILGLTYLTHSFLKFGIISSLHTYATKAGGYFQGIFFFTLFTYGFIPVFYYFMIIWAILSIIEMIAIQMIIPEMKPNLKGLYWVLKERQSRYAFHDSSRKEVKINQEDHKVIRSSESTKRKSGS